MAKLLPLVCLCVSFLLFSCISGGKKSAITGLSELGTPDSVYMPNHAGGFRISYYGLDKLIEVANPWDSTLAPDYFFIDNSGRHSIKGIPVIKAPVTNWSAFSSSQVVLADILGVLETLKSVAEPEYISNQQVKSGLQTGVVKNVGMASMPDLEVVLLSRPQFIFVSPFKDNQYDQLKEAGLVVVPDAGYLENSPLGRTEWIMFFGAFFNLEKEAHHYFINAKSAYQEVQQQLADVKIKPTITTGYLFQDIWFLPAGESYIATLFRDAGASYPYSETPGKGSLALDFEKVFHDTHQCEYWVLSVNHPGKFDYGDLAAMDVRYADFSAFKNRKVICSNTSSSGYFERGWVEPHVVLMDLAKAFHPDIFSEHQPVYFTFIDKE